MDIKPDSNIPTSQIVASLKAINETLSKIALLLETHVQASQTRNKILDEKLEEVAQEVAILNSTMEMKQGD